MNSAQVAIYCAPNPQIFTQTIADLRAERNVLQEAAIAAHGQEVTFALCGKAPNFTVVFAAPINERISDSDLQLLAQSIIDYYHCELVQSQGLQP